MSRDDKLDGRRSVVPTRRRWHIGVLLQGCHLENRQALRVATLAQDDMASRKQPVNKRIVNA